MKLAQTFIEGSLDAVKAAADGGKLTVYSVARPVSPDHPVGRSGALVNFELASPAFDPASSGASLPNFAANPAVATGSGTPGFARLFRADGTPIADLSAGPGDTEIKLSAISTTPDYPIALTKFLLRLNEN